MSSVSVRSLPGPRLFGRRRLLKLAAAAAVPGAWRSGAALAQPALGTDPFTLGVASAPGDGSAVVLWTRIAPEIGAKIARFSSLPTEDYVAARRGFAEPEGSLDVRWEVATDEAFRSIVRRGTAVALAELAHSVHVEIDGLDPGRLYYYRFLYGDAASAVGRTRPVPARAERLRFALAACQHYEYGYFGAYDAMRADDPELVVFVGDYIYEGGPRGNRFRPHPFPSARTLFDYRLRHALYKLDPALQRMHRHCPWVLTWDDHEVSNDYARDTGEDPRVDGAARRAAAYQAYYEHMPLAAAALVERFSHVRMYRRVGFGDLVSFLMLNDRQYRDRQTCQPAERGGSNVVEDEACPQRREPARTLLGAEQMAWLQRELPAARARWTFLAQQTVFAQMARNGRTRRYWTDGWDGYPAERARVLGMLADARSTNAVVLGGDVHAEVCDVKADFDRPGSPTIATEFCSTSITSPTSFDARRIAALIADNPHVRFGDGARRGYLLAEVGQRDLQVRLRVMDDVTRREPNVSTGGAWVVRDGKPGAVPA
jgi:alkaline phosphatase D